MSLIDAHLEEVSAEYHCVEEGSKIDCTMMHHYTLGLLTQSSMSYHVMVQLTEIYLLIQSRLVWSIAATVCLSCIVVAHMQLTLHITEMNCWTILTTDSRQQSFVHTRIDTA